MTAHVLIDASPAGRGEANLSIKECNNYDMVAVADRLDLFAEERYRPMRHHDPFSQNGVSLPQTHRVMLCLIDSDGVVTLHSYGAEFTEYYARGTAAYLRAQAQMPQMQNAAMQALAAVESAKMQAVQMKATRGPNGESLEKIIGGIIVPSS